MKNFRDAIESRWLPLGAFGLAAALMALGCAAPETLSVKAEASQNPGGETAHAETIRDWMLGRPGDSETDDYWNQYLATTAEADPKVREKALRDLLDEPIHDSLRQVILLEIVSDLTFQSRRARFLRRYGFYARWFNRLTFTTNRVLQGNLQSVLQPPIDLVFDLIGRPEATPAERRYLRLQRQLIDQGRASPDAESLERLQRKIDGARAELDIERGRWALDNRDPGLAGFYAIAALTLAPENKRAERLRIEAAQAEARRRRRGVASVQVGYPDADPPVEQSSPALLRAILSRNRNELVRLVSHRVQAGPIPSYSRSILPGLEQPEGEIFLFPGDAFLAWMITTLPDEGGETLMDMRQWASELSVLEEIPESKTAWLGSMLANPKVNPDLRLARAQSTRRGSMTRFIALGPDTTRARAYQITSRTARLWQSISGIGILYGFEVLYRAGVVAFSPPPPAEEMYDSAASFLRLAPRHSDSPEIARWLGRQYVRDGRYQDARAVMERFGMLGVEANQKLYRKEGRRLLTLAESYPPGSPARETALKRVSAIAPGTRVSRTALKKLHKPIPKGEPIVIKSSWAGIERWTGEPAPAGLPGEAAWFDATPSNGEIASAGFEIEAARSGAENITVRYPVMSEGQLRISQTEVRLDSLPPRTSGWIRFSLDATERNQREVLRLGRHGIPYEIGGGLGPGGVDLFPRLLPIEADPGSLKLYQD